MDLKVSRLEQGLKGVIVIPPDKSISHRAVMFSSLAHGTSVINNFSNGADCISTMNLFKQLGVDIEYIGKQKLKINSTGSLTPPLNPLDCGNSGTTMRLCSGILSSQNFNSVLFGDESLSKRPMKRVIIPLSQMGAKIDSNGFKAPLKITGSNLHGITYHSPVSSAQVKSCVLLAGLNAGGQTTLIEPYLSRNHTELMLKYMGADISTDKNIVTVKKSTLQPCDIDIAGDISSAAFFIVAGLIIPNSDIIIKNVGLNPTRVGIIDIVKEMGGNIEILSNDIVSGEPVGDIRVRYSELKGCEIKGENIPRLIDELPVIALLATQADGRTLVKDAQDLRKKESDRISMIVSGLRSIGADIEELEDGFIIDGKTELLGDTEVETHHDHRLAMTYYIAGLVCKKDILIKGFEWVNISFPEFEELIHTLYA